MNYRILAASDITTLMKMVDQEMAGGWRPQGGVCVSQHPNGSEYYYQAIIRVEG